MEMIWLKRASLLLICNLLFWSLSSAQNMPVSGPAATQEFTAYANSYNPIEVYKIHGDAPDSLTNKTDVDIIVEIRNNKGALHPGLKRKNDPNATRELKTGQTKEIDADRFRRGVGPDNKVELVITVPGKQKPDGSWDLKQVKWNLGMGHSPTYTKLNYIGRQKGYQIIFVYEKGLPKVDPKALIPKTHVDAHLCEPDDDLCNS